MKLRRSTRDIVAGGWRHRKKEEHVMEEERKNTEVAGSADYQAACQEPDTAKEKAAARRKARRTKFVNELSCVLLCFLYGIVPLAVLLFCIFGLSQCLNGSNTAAQEVEAADTLPEGAYIMTIPTADLSAAGEAGDLLQVVAGWTDENGSVHYAPVPSLQYLEISALTDSSVSVYMTEDQMLDYLAVRDRCSVALAARGGTEDAAEKLAWQAHFNAPTVKLALTEATKTVVKNGKVQLDLQVTVEPEEADPGAVTWESSNEAVAAVDESGMVTAVEAGTAVITASCGGVTASCTVTVYLTATDITMQEQAMVGVGGTVQLEAAVQPEGLKDPIAWSSSNEDVATVDENGTVTGVGVGSAEIIAVCGDVSAICQVSVQVLAEEIHLTPDTLALTVGETASIQAQVGPDNTTDKTVTWTSSNEAVATVAEDGTVTAVAAGTAEISAMCGDVTAICTVTVQ